MVFLSTTASDVDTDEAATTFVSRDTTPSGSAIGIGIAVILAAIIATGCIGLACGKCWIHQERRGRKMKYSPQPAYERPSAAPDDSADGSYSRYPEDGEIYNGAGVKGNGTKGDGSNRSNPSEMGSRSKTAFGRLAPTVSVGGLLSKPLALSDRGSGPEGAGDSRYMYDAEKGAGGGLDQGESGRSMGVRGNDGADVMLEHDYGDPGQTEVSGWCAVLWAVLYRREFSKFSSSLKACLQPPAQRISKLTDQNEVEANIGACGSKFNNLRASLFSRRNLISCIVGNGSGAWRHQSILLFRKFEKQGEVMEMLT